MKTMLRDDFPRVTFPFLCNFKGGFSTASDLPAVWVGRQTSGGKSRDRRDPAQPHALASTKIKLFSATVEQISRLGVRPAALTF